MCGSKFMSDDITLWTWNRETSLLMSNSFQWCHSCTEQRGLMQRNEAAAVNQSSWVTKWFPHKPDEWETAASSRKVTDLWHVHFSSLLQCPRPGPAWSRCLAQLSWVVTEWTGGDGSTNVRGKSCTYMCTCVFETFNPHMFASLQPSCSSSLCRNAGQQTHVHLWSPRVL